MLLCCCTLCVIWGFVTVDEWAGAAIQNATAKKWIGLVGSELFLEFEPTREKAAQFIRAGLGFDLLLQRG